MIEKITNFDWGNIWIYDSLVYFTGYISKTDFIRKSIIIPRFSKDVKQYKETKVINRGMFIKDLLPLKNLLPKNYDNFVP